MIHGDCRDILPHLEKVDLVLTDPPYGIGADKGKQSGKDASGFYSVALRKEYPDTWDELPSDSALNQVIASSRNAVVWGGNFFAHCLPPVTHWLVWDKENTMPTFSDCELAWTNLPYQSVKIFRLSGNGLLGEERDREHPTQKPLKLMSWCLSRAKNINTVLDPYMGSGTTLVACKQRGLSCIGIEREEKYCEIAVKRLSQEVFDFGGDV